MEKTKTLSYDWEFGHEELFIEVNSYANNNRLYIGLYHMEDGQPELFGDLTVNLPCDDVKANEAYISDFSVKSKLQFIRQHKLGRVVSRREDYRYQKVAFHLDRLAEFDKNGVDEFRRIHNIPKDKKPKVKRKMERER